MTAIDSGAKRHDARGGGLIMTAAMAAYAGNDALMKLLGADIPLGQLIALRGALIIVVIVAAIAVLPGTGLRGLTWMGDRQVMLRAFWDTVVSFFYLFALMHMPLANILAILNLAPLALIPLAWWLLGERVGPRRIVALLIGCVGALLVVRPGTEGFNMWAGLAFLAMLGVAFRDIVTRRIPHGAPSLVVALANVLAMQGAALVLWTFEPTAVLGLREAWMIALCAAFMAAAYVFMVIVVRLFPVADTAPWRYTILAWGVLAGWLVFGDWPDTLTFAGIVLIAISSLYTSLRQAKKNPPPGA